MDLKKRKNTRLQNFDYSQAGVYFVTICTENRKRLFWRDNVNGTHPVGAIHESPVATFNASLSEYGKIADSIIRQLHERFGIDVCGYVIMPNHVHLLIFIDNNDLQAIRESPLQGRSKLSKIVGYFKMNVSKCVHSTGYEGNIWQRSFFDHIIRNDDDLLRHMQYIEENPKKWENDEYY